MKPTVTTLVKHIQLRSAISGRQRWDIETVFRILALPIEKKTPL